jgi:hypothetical protein
VGDGGRGGLLPAFLDEAVGGVVDERGDPAEAVGLAELVAREVVGVAGDGPGAAGGRSRGGLGDVAAAKDSRAFSGSSLVGLARRLNTRFWRPKRPVVRDYACPFFPPSGIMPVLFSFPLSFSGLSKVCRRH